jgi:glycerophosphoryl diester phosphodiesterase
VQRIAPEIPTSCLTLARGNNDNVQVGKPGASPWLAGLDVDDFGGSVPHTVKAAGCKVWSPFFRDVTAEAMAEAKANGLIVAVWTVNEPAEMRQMIDLGADAIITDYPDRLRTVMAEKGLALPPATPVDP